jgi:hypothetical protein
MKNKMLVECKNNVEDVENGSMDLLKTLANLSKEFGNLEENKAFTRQYLNKTPKIINADSI